MSKYKTIDTTTEEAQLQQSIQQRLISNRIARATIQPSQLEQIPMSSNKSIIFIKLPKKPNFYINSFRSSLYESSLKRLKQQKVTILKQATIPNISKKKNYQSFQQEAIKKALQDNSRKKKEIFPSLHKFVGQQTRKQFSYLQKLQQKNNEDRTFKEQVKQSIVWSELPQRKTIYQVDGEVLGFKNLKQKYLELHQLSLNGKKKSELLQKPQYRRHQHEPEIEECENSKFKMERVIEEHMNRYNKKDYFQTKVNGFKTTIYPHDKYRNKQEEQLRERRKDLQSNFKHEHIENFIKRKRKPFETQNTIGQYPNSSFQLSNKGEKTPKLHSKQNNNPEIIQRAIQCTPWETDAEF